MTRYRTVRPAAHRRAGTLLIRGDVWFGKFSVDGRQVKRRLGTTSELTETQAARQLAKLAVTTKPNAPVASSDRRTVADAAAAMIRTLEDDGAKASTVYGYRAVAKRLAWFGAKTVDRVKSADVDRVADALGKPHDKPRWGDLSPRTRWQTLRLLDATLRYAVARGWATDPPRIDKPKRRRDGTAVHYLKPDQLESVLRGYSDDPLGQVMRTLTLTAAWTGLRRGELLGLRWDALDFAAQKLHVDQAYVLGGYDTPKSGHGRSVPLSARVARELRKLRLATPYGGDGDPVFTHPQGRGGAMQAIG